MHLHLGQRRFDTSGRAVVVALATTSDEVDRVVADAPDAIAVPAHVDPAPVRDRVDVPVATLVSGSIQADVGSSIVVAGPFHDLPPGERLGAFAAAALEGATVLVTTEVRAVRRVARVAARIRSAGAGS